MKRPISALMVLFLATYLGNCVSDTIDFITTRSSLIEKLQNHFMFALKDVMDPSLELALTTCQRSFKWDRWNCPTNDFFARRSSKHFDRESAYVMAITTAALMYTITKNCSSGSISECGCSEEKNHKLAVCSDNLQYAEDAIGIILHPRQEDSLDVQAYAALHNERLAKLVIRKSLRSFCSCDNEYLPCTDIKCWQSFRPFREIAMNIRQAYEKAVLVNVDNKGEVSWTHIPEDVLVYVQESPNYCYENPTSGWGGTRGRLCSQEKGKQVSLQERLSCRKLCRTCGLRIRGQSVIAKTQCNCHLTWNYEVKCDKCIKLQKKHYCD